MKMAAATPLGAIATIAEVTRLFKSSGIANYHSSPAGSLAELLAAALFRAAVDLKLLSDTEQAMVVRELRSDVKAMMDEDSYYARKAASLFADSRDDIVDLYCRCECRRGPNPWPWCSESVFESLKTIHHELNPDDHYVTVQVKSRTSWIADEPYDLIGYRAYIHVTGDRYPRSDLLQERMWRSDCPDFLVAIQYGGEQAQWFVAAVAARDEVRAAILEREQRQDPNAENTWTGHRLDFRHMLGRDPKGLSAFGVQVAEILLPYSQLTFDVFNAALT